MNDGRKRLSREASQHLVLLGLLVIWSVLIVIIDPRGEFPLNDDWLYTRVVEAFLKTRTLIRPQLAAVSLVFQTLWGTGFSIGFGVSHTVLRLSNLVLHLISVVALSALAFRLGASHITAYFAGLTLLVSPVALISAFSFMPEPAFLATVTMGILAAVQWEQTGHRTYGTGFSVFALLSVLVHPMAVFMIGWFLLRWLRQDERIGRSWPAVVALAGSIPFFVWYLSPDTADGMTGFWLSKSFGPETFNRIFLRLPAVLLYFGLFLIPLGIAAFRFKTMGVGLLFFMWAWGQGIWGGGSSPLPLPSLENIVHAGGFGYVGIQGKIPALPPLFWWVMTVLSMISMAGVLSSIFEFSRRRVIYACGLAVLPWAGRYLLGPSLLRAESVGFFALALWIILMWRRVRTSSILGLLLIWIAALMVVPPFYDRYLVPVLPLMIIVMIGRMPRPNLFSRLGLSLLILCSLIGVHDYLAWNRTRWEVVKTIQRSENVPAHQIDGGYEWAGWHFAWKGVPHHDTTHKSSSLPWWIRLWAPQIRPRYVVALSDLPGHRRVSEVICPTWIPGWSIILLERIPPSFGNIAGLREQNKESPYPPWRNAEASLEGLPEQRDVGIKGVVRSYFPGTVSETSRPEQRS